MKKQMIQLFEMFWENRSHNEIVKKNKNKNEIKVF